MSFHGFTVAIPSRKTIFVLEDKAEFHSFMVSSGFGNNVPTIYKSVQTATFPLIYKKVFSYGGGNVFVVQNASQLESLKLLSGTDAFIMQEGLFSEWEYSYSFVAYNGKVIKPVQELCLTFHLPSKLSLMVQQSQEKINRVAIVGCTLDGMPAWEQVERLTSNIVSILNYSGMGCIQYKIINSVAKVIEINPRICGGLKRDLFLEYYIMAWWNARKNAVL